jgi:SAM-dependent methyltransferase
MPWEAASFDAVTSFRGIWGTTPGAVAEIYRVVRPGGRVAITVWGHLKASPGARAPAPFRLAAAGKVDNQAVMVSLGRPGAGEQAVEQARGQLRDGLPLRAESKVVGYLARKPEGAERA